MKTDSELRVVRILYTNWKGVTSFRRIRPLHMVYGKNDFHPDEQWFIEAVDMEDPNRKIKTFAWKDIHYMEPASGI